MVQNDVISTSMRRYDVASTSTDVILTSCACSELVLRLPLVVFRDVCFIARCSVMPVAVTILGLLNIQFYLKFLTLQDIY